MVNEKINGNKVIYKCIVGSQAYGTNVEGSDIDIKGVYIQSERDISTFKYIPQIELDKDTVYYEVRRFIELLASANPTVLEMLFSPKDCIEICTPEFQVLLKHRNKFLTKECRNSFGGYAIQQIKKAKGLNKKINWEKEKMERRTPLDFCYIADRIGGSVTLNTWLILRGAKQEDCGLINIDHMKDCYAIYTDVGKVHHYHGIIGENSNSLRLSSIPKGILPNGTLYYNKDAYVQHCNAYKEYSTWLKERNTQRYVDLEEHGQKIDGKNMLHCRRLIETALEIPILKNIAVRRPNAEYLKSIRKGKVNLEELLAKAEVDIKQLDEAYNKSDLPERIDASVVQKILEEVRDEGISQTRKPLCGGRPNDSNYSRGLLFGRRRRNGNQKGLHNNTKTLRKRK